VVLKQPVASSFLAINDGCVKEEYKDPNDDRATFKWIMQKWKERLAISDLAQVLGHVRAKTKGSEYNPHNNHPIIISDTIKNAENPYIGDNTIIGVHNGSIRNDDELTKKYNFSRVGDVDSEIIFQMINKHKDNLDLDKLGEIFDEIHGLFAVLAYNNSKPNMVYGMKGSDTSGATEGRPLEIGYLPQIGTVVAISERTFVENALTTYDRWRVREDDAGEFPYVSVKWMKTMDTGVFTMDLDTPVDEKTDVSTLITHRKIVKKISYQGSYSGYNSGSTSHGTGGTSCSSGTKTGTQATPLPPATPSKPVVAEDKRSAVLHDLTDYSVDTKETDIPNGSVPEGTIPESLEVEILQVNSDSEESDVPSTDGENRADESGFTFEERKNIGAEFFSMQILTEEVKEPDMFISLPFEKQKEILAKYDIQVKNKEEVDVIAHILYDIVFPEGYAFGYTDGYTACEDERSTEDDSASDAIIKEKEEKAEKIKKLEEKLMKYKKIALDLKKRVDEKVKSAETK
jgi:hypothetical protein